GKLGDVLVFNDSKATNADSADKALGSFEGGIHWIAGGLAKDGGITALAQHFHRIERVYLIGEAADRFAAEIDDAFPVTLSGTLDQAVADAASGAAQSGATQPVILLSPACASFDQFPNFERRGDAFVSAIATLPGLTPLGRLLDKDDGGHG
ncbi:MAG: UDP-N-acetylmuramoyl-L-alanine--D-glutamate ligase, partial [Pseudomonadota bacterium]